MDHALNQQDTIHGRKLFCALEYASSLWGKPFDEYVKGGIEYPFYEAFGLYLYHALSVYNTISTSPQYRISRSSRAGKKFSLWPDFAIFRCLSKLNINTREWEYQNRQVLAVVEIKPLSGVVSSDDDEGQIIVSCRDAILGARAQAKEQAKYVFASAPDQKYVFAIYGTGPFWKYDVYERNHISPPKKGQDEDDYVRRHVIVSNPFLVSPLQKLGTEASDELFEEMISEMKFYFDVEGDDW